MKDILFVLKIIFYGIWKIQKMEIDIQLALRTVIFFWIIFYDIPSWIHKLNHDSLVPNKILTAFELWVFLHKKRSRKKMLEGLRYFLLQHYCLHFKWWIMVTFRVYKRFRILFVHIFVSLSFLSSPLTGAFCFTYVNSTGRSLMFLILHNCSLWAFFFSSIWVSSLVFLRGEPSETKICTKRIQNLS